MMKVVSVEGDTCTVEHEGATFSDVRLGSVVIGSDQRLTIGLAAAIGIVTSAIVLYNTYMTAVAIVSKTLAFFKGIETAAWWANNAAMYANPVMLIIAGVVALIAVIGYLCYKIEGWGSLWEGVVGAMRSSFNACVEGIKFAWNVMMNNILSGLDEIKLGWYRFKEAVGLGDSSENQAAGAGETAN
jgi:hypothetical protein